TLLLHRLLDLPGENALDGNALSRLVGPFVFQEIIEGGADTGLLGRALLHCPISFTRLRAKARSSFEIFCVFFTNPCSSTIRSCAMQKTTRAMRLPGRVLRTSQRPWPSGRHTGIPTDHPYPTV